jgi:tetratricopeptide (TPR) repeat protein
MVDNQNLYKNEVKKRMNFLRNYFLGVFGKTIISSIAFFSAIIGLLIAFSDITLKTYGWNGLVLLILSIMMLSVLVSISFLFKKMNNLPPIINMVFKKTEEDEELLSSELIETITKLHKKGKHAEVVRLASNISRPLWISGRYDERIHIGSFYEDSSERIKDVKNQIASLVDDLGWTNAVIGKIDDSQKNIQRGIKIAEKHGEFYLAAKGMRHLGTIELRFQENPDSAIKLLFKSLKAAESIQNEKEKEEMIAGIKYNISECYLMKCENSNALQYAKEVKDLLSKLSDKVRILKVNSLIARILLKDKKIDESKELFSNTLVNAKTLSRPDEIGKCLIGLGEIYIMECKNHLAFNILTEAIEVLTEIKSFKELNKANELLLKINLKGE